MPPMQQSITNPDEIERLIDSTHVVVKTYMCYTNYIISVSNVLMKKSKVYIATERGRRII